jgi:hypothetical protein
MGELRHTPFDPWIFEAEVALKLIPSEKLPSVAQDAMEAGCDGPAVVRMAILEAKAGWAIDQALPPMLAELGLSRIDLKDAAMRLAKKRAQRIISGAENPLPALPYFYRLMWAADSPSELIELGYLEDSFEYVVDDPVEQRAMAVEALENLLDPELGEQRRAQADAKWRRQREEAERDWPYVFNSPGRRALLRERFREQIKDILRLFPLLIVAGGIGAWGFHSWKFPVIYLVCVIVFFPLLGYWSQYRKLKWERRVILWRQRYPEDKI